MEEKNKKTGDKRTGAADADKRKLDEVGTLIFSDSPNASSTIKSILTVDRQRAVWGRRGLVEIKPASRERKRRFLHMQMGDDFVLGHVYVGIAGRLNSIHFVVAGTGELKWGL
ncbi:hypothetical protein GWI33_008714 [Rhynchophorus ferrugineus]|uniref:Uncharacterized protein n=1 Tax=Rhynchophorus ferrugineus TaxID=354439 RepID=A0A834MFS7_RHYFE|nr:hypothetical protein GWI33_008714 [Rhynchophorus ferrugineus]